MKIMSVNTGSSSLKFQILNMPEEEVLCSGLIERIGHDNALFKIRSKNQTQQQVLSILNHKHAVELLLKTLIENKIISAITEIKGVGHRVVQGGEIFNNSVILTDENIMQIEALGILAPLHNPVNVVGIKLFKNFFPEALHVGVFDTSFHQTVPQKNFLYAVPYEWYIKHKIRKYGFHGTSCRFVVQKVHQMFQQKDLKLIICHIGNGVSITAVDVNGCSVANSMGITPISGVPMGTRSGDIDPVIISFIAEKEKKTAQEVINDLIHKSGLLGISGISNDCRDLEAMIKQNNERALLAFEVQISRIVDYIASYYFLLKGVDCLIFTAGVGENSSFVRREVLKSLKFLHIYIDTEINETSSTQERIISTPDSSVKVLVVPTNEEIVIARDVFSFIVSK
ncbi:acetate kinase [Candidatus Phytoplasma melaleucae]|nr:acetate kinase ['Melaleuca sp.' phytoplasma]